MLLKTKILQAGFYLMTCDLYFTILVEVFMYHNSRKLIFLKLCRVNITQDYGLKPANKYQIIWQCHNLKITSHQQSPVSSIISLLSKHLFTI